LFCLSGGCPPPRNKPPFPLRTLTPFLPPPIAASQHLIPMAARSGRPVIRLGSTKDSRYATPHLTFTQLRLSSILPTWLLRPTAFKRSSTLRIARRILVSTAFVAYRRPKALICRYLLWVVLAIRQRKLLFLVLPMGR